MKLEIKRKFNIGDYVCRNFGEYPDYFSNNVHKLLNYEIKYDENFEIYHLSAFNTESGRIGRDEDFRLAHEEEIKYYKLLKKSKEVIDIEELFKENLYDEHGNTPLALYKNKEKYNKIAKLIKEYGTNSCE